MSGYGSYAGAGNRRLTGDRRQQQGQAQGQAQGQGSSQQFRPPIASPPAGYQQTPNPQNFGSPSLDQQRSGGVPTPQSNGYSHPSQTQSYFPPMGPQGIGDESSMGTLASQIGGMGLSGEGPPPSRAGKKKNRHAYHNIEQTSVASEAFNQTMGNAPQYVNQESAEGYQQHGSQQFAPFTNQFPLQAPQAPFSPGIQPGGQNVQKQIPQAPALSGTGVSAQGRVDPEQIPSVPRQRDSATQYYLSHVYPTMEMHLPPPGAIPFVAQDQGNSSPKHARLTLNNIPSSSDALGQTGLPLGLLLQPLAPLQAGERPIPVLDFGDLGPPRCRRCRAYINPFMIFRSGGNKLVCNMCTFPNDVSPEYFAPADVSGVRVDRAQRPELTTGTVEYLVPKEYWAKEPVGLRWLFVLDVSQDAVDKGYLQAFCEGVSRALFGDDGEITGEEQPDEDTVNENRNFPRASKVGFVTFDKAVYYYNCHVGSLETVVDVADITKEKLEQAQMLVMPDIEEPFVPLGSGGLFVDPYRSRHIIQKLLSELPKQFKHHKTAEPVLLPALESVLASLGSTGGKIVCSLATLPTWGPGRLFLRDKNDMHGIEGEKKLFQTEHPGWKKLASKMVESGVGVDFYIAAPAGRYMDVATIGHPAATSGGEVFFYPNFLAPRDSYQVIEEIKHNLHRETGYQALMKVRCSNGLQVSSYHGNFLQHNFGADLEFGVIDEDKTIGVMFSYDGKLDPKLDAHFQCALLYTTASGERRVRCTNTVASVSEGASEGMRFVDQDAVINMIAKEASTRMIERPLKEIRNALTEKTVDILAGYRKAFSGSHPPGQLVLPENLKEFGMYVLGLHKCRAFKGGHEPSDRRTYIMRLIKASSPLQLALLLYPRIVPIHSLPPESGFPDAETGHLVVPPSVRASFSRIEEGGAYLADDGTTTLLWLHAQVSPNLLEDLFGEGFDSLSSLPATTFNSLPVLDTHLNAQVRNILAYWDSFRGSKRPGLQLARQGLDGSEFEFARLLVEDRNGDAQSYVDWLVNIHRLIQMEMTGQRRKDDGDGGGGGGMIMGVESAVAGITSLWSGKEG